MTDSDQRLSRIEERLMQTSDTLSRTVDRLDSIGDRLEIVARLEERWQSHDMRLSEISTCIRTENERRSRIDDAVFDRLRELESQNKLNSHGRDLGERTAIPLAAAIAGGLAVYTIQLVWGG